MSRLMTPFAFLFLATMVLAGCQPQAGDETNSPDESETTLENGSSSTATNTDAAATNEHSDEAMVKGPQEAICVLVPVGDSGVAGTIHFRQNGESLSVEGQVTGLTPGKHGFHVHQFGDLTDQSEGKSTGGHFNPGGEEHGRPSDEHRHAGDFGNIEANDEGTADVQFEDSVAKFSGPNSIIGRGIVVHAQEDQFTQPTGDAGARVAIGVIGIANAEEQ